MKMYRLSFVWTILLMSLFVLGATGCRQNKAEEPNPAAQRTATSAPVTVTAASVEQRTVARQISAVGTLHGFEVFTITPKVEGRVQSINAEVGDRVPPNKVLLVIDPTDYELALNEAQRALDQELAQLGLKEPPEQFDIEKLPSVMRARLVVANAQRRYDRERMLAARNAVAQQDLEQIETDLKVAEATLEHVRLEAQATWAAVRHREAVLAQAQQRLEDTRVVAPAAADERTSAVAENETSQVHQARQSGGGNYVVAQRMVSVGEMVRAFPSTPVFELVMDDVLKLKADLPERYAGQVRVGQPVSVRVEAYPDEVFSAEIVRLNPTVNPDSRTFEIEAHVVNEDHRLRHGSFAKAEIVTNASDHALVAPLEAIVRYAGVTKVFRIAEGQAHETLVQIGARGDGWVELLGDLRADDLVAITGQSQLAEATPVKVREPRANTETPTDAGDSAPALTPDETSREQE